MWSTTYERVIPRDLFNEANLLKCYGRLWLLLDEGGGEHKAALEEEDGFHSFEIAQDDSSGDLSIQNLMFHVQGKRYDLIRPLNSRESWSLLVAPYTYADNSDFENIPVYEDDGTLSAEFRAFIGLVQ